MKPIAFAAILASFATSAAADAYIMGSGNWTCEKSIQAWKGTPIDKGQVAGWILGYWSFATTTRETAFIDTVERVGGLAIIEKTIEECRKARPDTPLHEVANGMIKNTK